MEPAQLPNTNKKRYNQSDVWKYVDKSTRVCKSCQHTFSKSTATSSIRKHLNNCNKSYTQTIIPIRPMNIQTQKHAESLLLLFLISTISPFSLVENIAFRSFCAYLNSCFRVPSRTTMSNHLTVKFQCGKESLKKKLQENRSKFNFTTDGWTDTTGRQFMSVTCHFVDNNFKLQEIIIAFREVPPPHTSERIASFFLDICEEFGIRRKIIGITTDNASNVVQAITKIEEKKIHVRCICHIMHLSVLSGLAVFESLIDRVRGNIKKIKNSPSLQTKMTQLSLSGGEKILKVILDVKTRWSSTYNMVERALVLKTPLQQLAAVETEIVFLQSNEWELLQEICDLLEPFKTCTEQFSAVHFSTIGEMHLAYKHLELHLLNFRTDCQPIKNGIEGMRLKLQTYFNKQQEDIIVATVLDPRIKMMPFNILEEDEVIEVVRKVFPTFNGTHVSTDEAGDSGGTSGKGLIGQLHKKRRKEVRSDDEIDKYLSMNAAHEDSNVIDWWSGVSTVLPNLTRMAVDYCCIMPSSTASERVFSTAGRVLSKCRSQLGDDLAEATILLNSWKKIIS